MNETERTAAVQYLGDGATLVETAHMIGVPIRTFNAEWIRGRRDADDGTDSDSATFYGEAQAARSRCRASLRAEARDEAGTRAATDKLAVLKALEDEVEPVEVASDNDTRIPIDNYSQETQLALHGAFSMMAKEDMARRAVAA